MRTFFFMMGVVSYIFICAFSCSGTSDNSSKKNASAINAPIASVEDGDKVSKTISLSSPTSNSSFKINEDIDVSINIEKPESTPDSVVVSFDGKKVVTLHSEPWNCVVPKEKNNLTGRKTIKAMAYLDGKANTTANSVVIVYSDIVPDTYGYEVKNTYPHDNNAFTQGLFYDNGRLFEGTGQEGYSSLREVELNTGKVLRQANLAPNLFGEGITLYDDLIYQVTWTSKVGFVYDKSTFKQLRKFNYNTDAWGLTTVGDKLAMSDGSNLIYFIEPKTFSVLSTIEVYDNEKQVRNINEMEYINGEIWANIWMTNTIVRIDVKSGKVTGYIDLTGIISEINTQEDVLNGIAYDAKGNRLFVTGKNWPKLFEITLKK